MLTKLARMMLTPEAKLCNTADGSIRYDGGRYGYTFYFWSYNGGLCVMVVFQIQKGE